MSDSGATRSSIAQVTREKMGQLTRRAGVAEVPRGPIVAVLLLVLIAGFTVAGRALTGAGDVSIVHDSEQPLPMSTTQAEVDGSGANTGTPAPTEVCVHVVGAVARPGVYRLQTGARIEEAIEAAGGLLGSAAQEGVNLARPVEDGEQVYVPTVEEIATGGGAGPTQRSPGGSDSAATLVDINSASDAELQSLPGIGPSTAAKIVADREEKGPFAGPEDLMRVSGIGSKKYEALADLITVR